jgi:L-threonylcarbamoyladenylate synthase
VSGHFSEGIALILDGGPCAVGVESTILSLEGETPVILRAGGLPREELEAVLGPVEMAGPGGSGREEAGPSGSPRPLAPGRLPGHYAPRTPLRLLPDIAGPGAGKRVGYLAFRQAPASGAYAAVEVLSGAGDLREAAAGLFAALHRLDAAGLDLILAEPVPEQGLGPAIMDRLRKAAAGSAPASGT